MKHTKRTIRIAALLMSILMCCTMVACSLGQIPTNGAVTLDAPNNVRIENSTLLWNFVENALGYTVKIVNGENADINNSVGIEVPVNETQYSLADLADGNYTIGVKARGDAIIYISSSYTVVQYKRTNDTGSKYEDSILGAFGAFDDVNTKNSYLGYGIDIINASAITSKDILMNYPIFDMDKLMNETLLKTNERNSKFESIEANSIEEFLENMSLSSSITSGSSVSASGIISGIDMSASVSCTSGLKTQFTKTSDYAYSQYFLEIISENQSYWLILQTSEDRYKEILSEEFKKDLYDTTVSPAQLFSKYGTHLLTSVAMGGNICMYYTMYSYSEEDMSKAYAEIATELKQNVDASYGASSIEGEKNLSYSQAYTYIQTAKNYGVQIDKNIISSGGDFYGISSESSLYDNYSDWQKSLDKAPVVIGIKDNNSLYAIWNLLDLNIDGAVERYNELYTYFQEYGTKSYKELLEVYKLNPPIAPAEIIDICIEGKIENYKPGQVFQVNAGDVLEISFDVLPANANDYTKTFAVDNSSIATINENGVLNISEDALPGDSITVTITAGEIKNEINLSIAEIIIPTPEDVVSKISYNVNDTIKGEVYIGRTEDEAVLNKTTFLINAFVDTYSEYYSFAGWYTAASGGILIAENGGSLLKNVDGYTDADGRWIHNGDVELYAHWSSKNPDYEYIETASELKAIAENPSGKYMLISDIDMNTDIWEPISEFSGEIDGDNHSIFNFYVVKSGVGTDNIGFIAVNNGIIRNLTIGKSDSTNFDAIYSVKYIVDYEEGDGEAYVYIGAFAGSNSGIISNCHLINACIEGTLADVNNDDDLFLGIGGIVGQNYYNVYSCTTKKSRFDLYCSAKKDSGDDAHGYIAGIVGYNFVGEVKQCGSEENILNIDIRGDGTKNNKAHAYGRRGGVVAIQEEKGSVIACYARGNTGTHHLTETSYTDSTFYDGEILGKNNGGIEG